MPSPFRSGTRESDAPRRFPAATPVWIAAAVSAVRVPVTGPRKVKAAPEVDPNALMESFERRELLQSTAVFDGVAFPHAALPALTRPVLALARSEAGVPFSALNGLDTHIFVAVVTPEGDDRLPLQLLARLSRLFQSQKKLKQRLLETSEPERLLELLREAEAAL